MKLLDLRDKGYANETAYYVTYDNDLIAACDMTLDDEPKIKVLINGFYPGTLEQFERTILERALR